MTEDKIFELVVNFAQSHQYVSLSLGALGALVVIGAAVVAATPSQEDDRWLAGVYSVPILGGILKFLARFSPFQKTPKS